jgi:hypothetical protein
VDFLSLVRSVRKKGVPTAVGFPHCAGSGEASEFSKKWSSNHFSKKKLRGCLNALELIVSWLKIVSGIS